MPNQGFWVDGLQGTKDRMNAGLLQYDTIANQPAAGQTGRMFYATDTFSWYRDNGVSWDMLNPMTVRKPSDETVNNSTVLQNDDDLLFAVGTNETWFFIILVRSDSSATADIKIKVTVPTAASLIAVSAGTSTTGTDDISTYIGTNSRSFYGAGYGWGTIIIGTVRTAGTAGNLQLQWAQNAAEVSDTKVLADSAIIAWKVA